MERLNDPEVIPLLEERARLEKRTVELSRDVLRIQTREHAETLTGDLLSEAYVIERRPVGEFVDVSPEPRTEGDSTIYPVIEEVFVRRLLLREEIRITPKRTHTPYRETVTLRRQEATVDRNPRD